MTRKIICRFVALAAVSIVTFSVSQARAATLTPLSGFGTNGWLAPGAIPQLDTSNSQRGLSVTTSGNVVLVDRDSTLGNNVYVLSGASGAVNGTLTPPSGGYSGGTFVINATGTGDDGSIYVGNLVTNTTHTFKVYSWASDSDFTTPGSVAFSLPMADASWGGVNRVGDTFAATGSGAGATWASAGSNSAAGLNSTYSFGTVDGSNSQTTYTAIPGTATSSNGFRLGISFLPGTSAVLGTQGTTLYTTNISNPADTFAGTTGAAQRPLAGLLHNGTPYVATVDTNSSEVTIYDLTDPSNPLSVGVGNATSGSLSANANGTGGIGWGPNVGGDDYLLYAMSTNQGIQAFTVTVNSVPEPGTWALLAVGATTAAGLGLRRRRKA